jgi:ribosomal protein S12 methylthiotransferase accessory factor
VDIRITFPGGKRVDADIGGHVIATDQPGTLGGGGSAPAPFDLFLASLGTCAGIYVLGFLQARGLSTDGLVITERVVTDEATGLPASVDLEIRLPAGTPEKYRSAIVRAAEHCKVKKTIEARPVMAVRVVDAMVEEPRHV